MKKTFDDRLKMFDATRTVLQINETLFEDYAAMKTAYEQLQQYINALMELKKQQECSRKGYTEKKQSKRNELAATALKICGKLRAYASVTNNLVLFNKMNITLTAIKSRRSTSALTLSQSIYNAALEIPEPDKITFAITEELMNDFQNCLAAYGSVMVSPQVEKGNRKTQTDAITQLIKTITQLLLTQLDGLMLTFEALPFYSDYKNARKIVNAPTLQARITGIVTTEKGEPVAGATVVLSSNHIIFEEVTDVNGRYKLSHLHPEIYQFKIGKEGYKEYVIDDVDIYAGEQEKVDVRMKII
ncbi:MAG: carboxypeptidase-like regulatory domain-containing protein [Bacteroidota bacterium]